MHTLTREVRFPLGRPASGDGIVNGHGGYPPADDLSPLVTLRLTLAGTLDPASNYLVNIQLIDKRVRQATAKVAGRTPSELVRSFAGFLERDWPANVRPRELSLSLNPFTCVALSFTEPKMIRISRRFEFSAAHRLHNPELDDETNRRTFGKCNNPAGHGHNYELEVTVAGELDAGGVVIGLPELERIVEETVIERFDHKHLNLEVEEFRSRIPSVENIAEVIYQRLSPALKSDSRRLHSVKVWETPRTWCEYGE